MAWPGLPPPPFVPHPSAVPQPRHVGNTVQTVIRTLTFVMSRFPSKKAASDGSRGIHGIHCNHGSSGSSEGTTSVSADEISSSTLVISGSDGAGDTSSSTNGECPEFHDALDGSNDGDAAPFSDFVASFHGWFQPLPVALTAETTKEDRCAEVPKQPRGANPTTSAGSPDPD